MKVGAMNHPRKRPEEEIRWMAEFGLDFIDLTLEPPGAFAGTIDIPGLRRLLEETGLGIVGHTAPYLPLGHPYKEVRQAAVREFLRCAEVFAELGAQSMSIHPDPHAPMQDRAFTIAANLESLREMLEPCRRLGIIMMIENIHGGFNTLEEMGELLTPIPGLGLHLDIGHCNLEGGENTAESILDAWGDRLKHVHIHDNLGGAADLHLPLGAGTLDVPWAVGALKSTGYDGTITVEVYSPDRSLLKHSVEILRQLWG
jgi:sugar phosphate isomerase/epimerase